MVLIGAYELGVGEDQIRLQHIGVGEQVPGAHSGGDVVGLVVDGVFQKAQGRVVVEQLVELFGQVAPDDVKF